MRIPLRQVFVHPVVSDIASRGSAVALGVKVLRVVVHAWQERGSRLHFVLMRNSGLGYCRL